ncbi:MAG: hypothetical protein ACTSW4_00505 [Candidatus Ranarchaeia archaeon]
MTSFEHLFAKLKQELEKPDLYKIWPCFTRDCDVEEYSFVNLPSLGTILLLNCAACDGPSDMRHNICMDCVSTRKSNALKREPEKNISTVALCRFYRVPFDKQVMESTSTEL